MSERSRWIIPIPKDARDAQVLQGNRHLGEFRKLQGTPHVPKKSWIQPESMIPIISLVERFLISKEKKANRIVIQYPVKLNDLRTPVIYGR